MTKVYILEESYDYEGDEIIDISFNFDKITKLQNKLVKEYINFFPREKEDEKADKFTGNNKGRPFWSQKINDCCFCITEWEAEE